MIFHFLRKQKAVPTTVNCALAITFFWLLFDLTLRFVVFGESTQPFMAQLYNQSILLSFFGAFILLYMAVIAYKLYRPFGILVGIVSATAYTLDLVSNIFTYKYLYTYFSGFHLGYVVQDPEYIVNALKTYLTISEIIGLPIVMGLFFLPFLTVFKKTTMLNFDWRPLWVLAPVLIMYVAVFLTMTPDSQHFIVLPNVNSSVQIVEYIKNYIDDEEGRETVLKDTPKMALPKKQFPTDELNTIVLIINESWSRDHFTPIDPNTTGMPKLISRLLAEKNEYFLFNSAFANSTATDLSWPAIMTGISPHQPYNTLMYFPLISNLTNNAGFDSVIFSSWRLEWANMWPFLQGGGFDVIIGASQIGAEIVNDLGIDDMITANQVRNFLIGVPKEKPLFLVFGTNSLHKPYQQTSSLLPDAKNYSNPYMNALGILDESIDVVLDALKEIGRYDKSLIFITADHGDGILSKNEIPRLTSFYDYFTKIPFVVKVPKNLNIDAKKHLSINVDQNVQNLDIAPTIAHLLGYCTGALKKDLCESYLGSSLFQNIKSDRVLLAINTNDVRKWVPEGFGIYQDHYRIVFSSLEPNLKGFNVRSDPFQTTDIWKNLPLELKEKVKDLVTTQKHFHRVFSAYGSMKDFEQ